MKVLWKGGIASLGKRNEIRQRRLGKDEDAIEQS